MLFELGLPSFDRLLHNYKVSFYMSQDTFDDMLVQCLRKCQLTVMDLCLCTMSLHAFLLSVCVVSLCLSFIVYGPCV